jgi:hypothetical protein
LSILLFWLLDLKVACFLEKARTLATLEMIESVDLVQRGVLLLDMRYQRD